jgi:hypothetical protein
MLTSQLGGAHADRRAEVPPAETAITLYIAGSQAAKELIWAELLPPNP